jgi:hypothetical protein
LGPHSPTSPATPNPTGQSPPAAVSVSNARAEASRKNGAKSRRPKTPEGKTRAAQNALKHGLRAQKYVVLPEEDAAEFAGLEAALIEELAPRGALQTVLARRIAVAAWRLARADHIETELFAERGYGAAGPAVALIRDGNGCRSFETLLRYRGAAMAEFWRALKTLKALQAEQANPVERATRWPGLGRTRRPRTRRRPRHGRRSSIARDQANPSAGFNTLSPRLPRAVTPCTSPPPPGCRTNPSPAQRLPRRAPGPASPRTNPSAAESSHPPRPERTRI